MHGMAAKGWDRPGGPDTQPCLHGVLHHLRVRGPSSKQRQPASSDPMSCDASLNIGVLDTPVERKATRHGADTAVYEQAPYIQQGLPLRMASLLSGKRISRVDVAAHWVAMQKDKELEMSKLQNELQEERLRLILKVNKLEVSVQRKEVEKGKLEKIMAEKKILQDWYTYQYLQVRGLLTARGIIGAKCPSRLPL